VYEGRQPALVDQALWDRAQTLLSAKSASRERRPAIPTGRPLVGRLFDDKGNAMSPAYTTKRNGQRYHYYVSQALLRGEKAARGTIARVPAHEIERLVVEALEPAADGKASSATSIGERVDRVVVHADRIEIMAVAEGADREVEPHNRTIVVKARLAYRNRAAVLEDGRGEPDPVVLRALARAHEWRRWLEKGEARSTREIAAKAGVTAGHVQKMLPLAFLAPRLTRELLDGRRRLSGGLMARLRRGIPLDWDQQLDIF
jgi:site-specific DNA recombinase